MIQSLYYRKASFYGSEIWKIGPWEDQTKSSQQTLYDKGYDIAALLEDFDKSNRLNSGDERNQGLKKCEHRCAVPDKELQTWYETLLQDSPTPLYWPAQPLPTPNNTKDDSIFPPIAFPSFHIAHLLKTYWALRIILGDTTSTISNLLSSSLTADTRPRDLAFPDQLTGASLIVSSIPYCTSPNMGLLGVQKCIFPLKTALSVFQKHPGPMLERCWEVYRDLFERSELRFARDLVRDGGEGIRKGGDVEEEL
jgi:hypothetical protein